MRLLRFPRPFPIVRRFPQIRPIVVDLVIVPKALAAVQTSHQHLFRPFSFVKRLRRPVFFIRVRAQRVLPECPVDRRFTIIMPLVVVISGRREVQNLARSAKRRRPPRCRRRRRPRGGGHICRHQRGIVVSKKRVFRKSFRSRRSTLSVEHTQIDDHISKSFFFGQRKRKKKSVSKKIFDFFDTLNDGCKHHP